MSECTCVNEELLELYKKSIGDFNGSDLDDYYKTFLMMAKSDLITDDISSAVLDTPLGRSLIVLYSEALMNKTDIATNPTISLLRNKLSLITKGDRVTDV